jgi:hypothetical protein
MRVETYDASLIPPSIEKPVAPSKLFVDIRSEYRVMLRKEYRHQYHQNEQE